MIAIPQISNVIITISAAHKVWSITSHLLSSRGALLTFKPPSICVWVSCSQREKGSGGHLFHVSWQCSTWLRGYQAPSISLWSEHGPLLPVGNPPNQRADSLKRCYGERGEEELQGAGRKRMGRGLNKARDYRKWQCMWSDKPLAMTLPHPGGGLRATRL